MIESRMIPLNGLLHLVEVVVMLDVLSSLTTPRRTVHDGGICLKPSGSHDTRVEVLSVVEAVFEPWLSVA